MGMGFPLRGWECSRTGQRQWSHSSVKVLNVTALFTDKCTKRQILCYTYFTAITFLSG